MAEFVTVDRKTASLLEPGVSGVEFETHGRNASKNRIGAKNDREKRQNSALQTSIDRIMKNDSSQIQLAGLSPTGCSS